MTAKPPALRTLPPTDEALELNIKRAHFAATLMKKCLSGILPSMNPLEYGWELGTENKSLKPIMLPATIEIAPPKVLQATRCQCTTHCQTNRCSCYKARIPCSDYCYCTKTDTDTCENREHAVNAPEDSDNEDAEEEA